MRDAKPGRNSSLAGIGAAFIGAGGSLVAAGLTLGDSVALAAAGAGIMGVGFVYLLRGAWRLG